MWRGVGGLRSTKLLIAICLLVGAGGLPFGAHASTASADQQMDADNDAPTEDIPPSQDDAVPDEDAVFPDDDVTKPTDESVPDERSLEAEERDRSSDNTTPSTAAPDHVADDVPTPDSVTAGKGVVSSPSWLPIRSATIGCAYRSPGSSCKGTYHGWWAIDFGASVNTPVYAAGSGQVKIIRKGNTGCSTVANALQINHGSGVYSYYTHLDKITVSDGAWVDPFTKIGTVGRTGLAKDGCWPHLHYEKRKGTTQGTAVDPGGLKACQGGKVVTYPAATGKSTWKGLPGHKYGAKSDGAWCANSVIRSVANKRYVSAELNDGGAHRGKLRARASSVGGWERFTFVGDCSSSTGCAIKSRANGKYVSAEANYTGSGAGMLRARASLIGTWERFVVSGDCRGASGCALKARANGRYVSAELSYTGGNYGMLRARASSVGTWERFNFSV